MDLSRWVERHAPDRVAIHCEGRDLTYGVLAERVARSAGSLRAHGVGRGDRVAHLGLNSPELLQLLFACARIGAILVPLNWRLTASEHRALLADAAPRLAVAEAGFALDGAVDLAGLAQGEPVPASGGADDPLLMVHTSGTTGRPKGALLTQGAITANADIAVALQQITAADHVLAVLPMFHVGGLNIQVTPALRQGARITLHRRFDAAAMLADIGCRRPSLTLVVPTVAQALFTHPDWPTTDLSSLRLVVTGSTIVPRAVIDGFHARGIACGQVYGATETAPCAIGLGAADARARAGSVGRPLPPCAARIVDDDGNDCAPGQPGEIWLQGPNLMQGYWGEAPLGGQWFRSGDIGYRDAEGWWWVIDRKKDVVISGGENVYPAELEAVLLEDPRIAEAAVVGRPDARWGEVPVAVVVARSAIDAAQVLALFEGKLARFKHPRAVAFVAALPRNAMGKVQKQTLKASLTASA